MPIPGRAPDRASGPCRAARPPQISVVRTPEGYSSESEGGYSYGLRPVVSSGNLWLTQDDVEVLVGAQPQRLETISVGVDEGWG